ncbi:MAG: MlaD family protein [Gemmataceae bacterium]
MSRSLARWQAIILGLIVCLAVGLGGVGLFAIGSKQWLWQGTFHVQVGFPNIQGVEVGSRVRVRGEYAGEVVRVIRPTQPGDMMMLCLRLDGDLRDAIRQDASAQILSEGMLGGKVVEIDPGSASAPPIAENALIASKPTNNLSDAVDQLTQLVEDARGGRGTLGKLLTEDEAYHELVQLLRQSQGTMASVQQNVNSVKDVPLIGSLFRDPKDTLLRLDCECNRKWFAEEDLFTPGRAALTSSGKQRLDAIAPWINGLKHKGSEVVIVAYASPNYEANHAQRLTEQQSAAVLSYLVDNHDIKNMGWGGLLTRKATPLGWGTKPLVQPKPDGAPDARVEVLVFVPQE